MVASAYSRMVASAPHPPSANYMNNLKPINDLLVAGEQGTEALVLLWFAQLSLVGRWPPCPVLQHRNVMCLFVFSFEVESWLLENRARRPLFYYDLYGNL